MKRKAIIAICCAVMLCALTGCQLARENAGTNVYEDNLVGVFVTTEYLDLFDLEGYLNDNLRGISGGEIIMDGDTQKYQDRLYATMTTRILTSEETGETLETEEYVFEGIEGIPCFSATVPASPGRDSYRTSMSSDPAISEGKMILSYGDETNSTAMEGTIYVSPTGNELTYYFNPVYQSADGSVYLSSGSGIMFGNWTVGEGEQISQTMDAAYTVVENGKTKTESISVKLSVSVMFAPEKITILQMNVESGLLSRMEYTPGELPETFAPEPRAAYLIVETRKRDATGVVTIARNIYSRDAGAIETFFTRADGICVKHWTQIEWP